MRNTYDQFELCTYVENIVIKININIESFVTWKDEYGKNI